MGGSKFFVTDPHDCTFHLAHIPLEIIIEHSNAIDVMCTDLYPCIYSTSKTVQVTVEMIGHCFDIQCIFGLWLYPQSLFCTLGTNTHLSVCMTAFLGVVPWLQCTPPNDSGLLEISFSWLAF